MKNLRLSQNKVVSLLKNYWPLIPAIGFYLFNAIELDFIQDDAYISYRYVANYLNGDGLVYNIGERVEGITNFGWVVLLIFLGSWGLDYLFWSQLLGFLASVGVIFLSFRIARKLFDESIWPSAAVVMLVGINPSLAYWSPAGLETALFSLLAMLSIYYYLERNWLLIWALTLAVLIRPDGAMIAGLLIVIEALTTKHLPRFTLISTSIAFILSVPFVAFKLSYYGSIAPNPFYAKTSFDFIQLQNGLEYVWRYLTHYGFYGLVFIVPLYFWRKLSTEFRVIWLFAAGFTLYIILVGGDVLKVHRFFLPMFGPIAILTVLSLRMILRIFSKRASGLILPIVMIPLLILTYQLPQDFVRTYNRIEKNFTRKMLFYANELKKSDQTNFSVALPTIGILGYELIGHTIIDMLGLTDSTIARYSEKPIKGMKSTWKEQKHNSRYILERAPDYIIFSTGVKPSAPAEKALLLYSQFLESYRSVAWFFPTDQTSGQGKLTAAFKKVRPIEGEIVPVYPLEYVELYKKGLEASSRGKRKIALQLFNQAIKVSPKPYSLDLLYHKASTHLELGQNEIVLQILNMILKQDSMVFDAHKDLYSYSTIINDTTRIELHKRWLLRLVPWYFARLDSLTQRNVELLKASRSVPAG